MNLDALSFWIHQGHLMFCLRFCDFILANMLVEGPGQAGEVGLCEPHEVQQGQVQGPTPGSG